MPTQIINTQHSITNFQVDYIKLQSVQLWPVKCLELPSAILVRFALGIWWSSNYFETSVPFSSPCASCSLREAPHVRGLRGPTEKCGWL